MTARQMTGLTKKKTILTKKSSTSNFPEAYRVEISDRGRALALASKKELSFAVD